MRSIRPAFAAALLALLPQQALAQTANPQGSGPIVAHAMTSGDRSVVSAARFKRSPARPAGIVPNNTNQARRASPVIRSPRSERPQPRAIPISSWCASIHGQRAASSSGTPPRIFATFASG